MGGRKDLITAGLTLGALADAEAKAKGKMSAIIATESGSAVSFTAADAAPVVDLTAAIVPVQSGSGDPSPTNIRPISGWTECKVYRSGTDTSDPTIYTVTFGEAGTVYDGTVDVTTGKLTVDKAMYTFNGTESFVLVSVPQSVESFNYFRWYSSSFVASIPNWNINNTAIMSCYPVQNQLTYWYSGGIGKDSAAWTVKNNAGLCIRDDRYSTADDLKAALIGQTMVYLLATPLVYDLSPVEIQTLVGQNTILADTGNVTVKYTADTKAYIDKYIAARRNG